MSPHTLHSSALPESMDDTMAFLRAVEHSLPSSRRDIEERKRLLAMHILDPDLHVQVHNNPMDIRREYRDENGALSNDLIAKLGEQELSYAHRRFLWAMRYLGKNTGDVRLTKAEKDELRTHFDKLHPLLGLDLTWRKYLEDEPHRAQFLQSHPAIGDDVDNQHEILKSIFDFDPDNINSESLFHVGMGPGLYDSELDWIDLVLDLLNRDASYEKIRKTGSFFDADEHGFMQPYEHHPSMWSFFQGDDSMHVEDAGERIGLGHHHPRLMKAWIDHDDDVLRQFGEEFVVTGKSMSEMEESGILDTLWAGITGGRDAWKLSYNIDSTYGQEELCNSKHLSVSRPSVLVVGACSAKDMVCIKALTKQPSYTEY